MPESNAHKVERPSWRHSLQARLRSRKAFAMKVGLSILFLQVACRTTPLSTPTAAETVGASAPLSHTFATLAEFKKLSGHPHGLVRDVVKFTLDFDDPTTPVYFQNTAQYEFHLPFLNAHYPRPDGEPLSLDAYSTAIYGTPNAYPAGKIYTAGWLTWSESWKLSADSTPGTMTFDIYMGGVGATPDQALYVQQFPEIEKTFKRLRTDLPFAADRLAFVLPLVFRFGDDTVRSMFKQAGIAFIYATQTYRDEFLKTSTVEGGLGGELMSDLPETLCPTLFGDLVSSKRAQTKVGSLVFAFDYCQNFSVFGTPGSTPWLLKRVALVDSSLHVAEPRRGTRVVIDIANMQPEYSAGLDLTHHNGCDTLRVSTPDGVYKFENGAVDPGSISQDNCGSHAGKLKWDYTYSDGTSETGTSDTCKSIYANHCE